MTTEQTTQATAQPTHETTVPLGTPIVRGDQKITAVTLRKPKAGQLRGLSLSDLLQTKVDAIATVLPRISTPTLLKHEVDNLEPEDLVALGTEVVAFLLPKDKLEAFLSE